MSGHHSPGLEECQQVGCSCLHCFYGVKFLLLCLLAMLCVWGRALSALCHLLQRDGLHLRQGRGQQTTPGPPTLHMWTPSASEMRIKSGQKIFFWWFLKIFSNMWPRTVLYPLSGRVASICRLEPMLEMQYTHNLYPQNYISFPRLRCFPASLFCETSKKLLNPIKNSNYS